MLVKKVFFRKLDLSASALKGGAVENLTNDFINSEVVVTFRGRKRGLIDSQEKCHY